MTLPEPELVRTLRGFALLLHSGIGVADAAFLLAREEQPPLKNLLNTLGENLDAGDSLADAMTDGFQEHTRAMVRIGEETGRLPDMLETVANTYDEEVDNAVGALTSMIEPLMIVGLAVIVGGIVIALFAPLVSIIENLGG
jgi:type IV pilus assembly protein PilC